MRLPSYLLSIFLSSISLQDLIYTACVWVYKAERVSRFVLMRYNMWQGR